MPPASSAAPKRKGSDLVLERLNRLHPKIIDLGLERVHDLLARLDHPEGKLPPVVHFAGTNGKGSTLAYLRAMLEAEGRRVHCYTSPHLVRFHERIRLAGDLIDEAELVALLEHCEEVNEGRRITYFEITTIAAFLAFARVPADILLLETGLGGRLDATNVFDRPLLTVLTPISRDHTQFLGESLAEIAFEKAGIMKPGVTAVVGRQPADVLAVVRDRARVVAAPLACQGHDWDGVSAGGALRYRDGGADGVFPLPILKGPHQVENAALAVAAAKRLGSLAPGSRAIEKGLREARWPGRLQRLGEGPLVAAQKSTGDPGWELWLDGGHNEAAGAVLAESISDWRDRPVHLIFGMLNTKAADRFLAPLAARAASLTAVTIPGEPNALSAEEAAQRARQVGFGAKTAGSVAAALDSLLANQPPGRVLICGSLYLAGRVLAEND